MEVTKKEIEEIIEQSVEKALDLLGLDFSERSELRQDFVYLRKRRTDVENLTEEQVANEVLDKNWVRTKRNKELKRREFVENHIAKILAGLAIGLIAYALFGAGIFPKFL